MAAEPIPHSLKTKTKSKHPWCHFAVLILLLAEPAAAAEDCRAPAPVCATRATVFAVSSFDPLGSAVRVGPDLLVTNRHIVADETRAQVRLADGRRLAAQVVASSYPGDLVLLRVEGLGPGPVPLTAQAEPESRLFAIGTTGRGGQVGAFPEGRVLLLPAPGKPLARLHHSAVSRPGHSGGALVDDSGRLIAILAAGGEGRNEAIPAGELTRLRALSGPDHLATHRRIGQAIRRCALSLESLQGHPAPIADETAAALVSSCTESANRLNLELAGQALGRAGRFDLSAEILAQAVARDPHAINSRLSLAVSLHLARRYGAAVAHLAWLLEILPEDPQVLRLGIQAGKWGGDPELAQRALALLEQHHPAQAPAARGFLAAPIPPPTPP
jgi:hypothetical protein